MVQETTVQTMKYPCRCGSTATIAGRAKRGGYRRVCSACGYSWPVAAPVVSEAPRDRAGRVPWSR